MIYTNKKVNAAGNIAQQTAKIIANVVELESKNLVRFEHDSVFLHPQLWKDKATALNWIKCVYLYCCVKRKFRDGNNLYFKNIATEETIGSMINKKPKVLIL